LFQKGYLRLVFKACFRFQKLDSKINNISCELEKIAEMIGQISLLSKLREISQMTMKFVVTNQSLYI